MGNDNLTERELDMAKREYFPAFFSYKRTLKGLTDEQMGRVFRAALEYAETGMEPDLDPLEMMGFAFMREDIDRARTEYEKMCDMNREKVQKRWDKSDTTVYQSIPDDTAVCDGIPEDTERTKANANANANANAKAKDKANGNVNVSDAPDGGPKTTTKPKRSGHNIPPDVEEVRQYIESQGYNVDADRFCDYYSAQGWRLSNGQPVKDWQACVRTWNYNNNAANIRAAPVRKQNNGDPLMEYLDSVIAGDA